MARAHTAWTVLPHGPLEQLSPNVWRVEGALPRGPVRRVMTVARRADGSLVIHNAIALAAAELAALDALGPVATLVVPNGYHRLDAKVFLDRYPSARVLCPPGARARVEQVVPVAGSYTDLPADGAVELVLLDGTKQREGAMIVRAPGDTTVVFNDLIFNTPHGHGLTGLVLKLTGSSGGPRISRISKLLIVADKAAVRAHVERLAALPDLRRVIVSHHETISTDPAGVLRQVAAAL